MRQRCIGPSGGVCLPEAFLLRCPINPWTPLSSLQNPIPKSPTVASSCPTSFPPCRAHWIVTHSCRSAARPPHSVIFTGREHPIRLSAPAQCLAMTHARVAPADSACATAAPLVRLKRASPRERFPSANDAAVSNISPPVCAPSPPARSSRWRASARACRVTSLNL